MQLRAAVARRLPTGVKRLAGRLRRARQTLEFRIWNALNGREGHKLISVYGSHRIAIDVADFRAYRIWRLGGSQSEKVRMIAALCDAKPALFIDVGEGAAGLMGRAAWWRALLEFSPSCLRSANKDIAETWRFFRRYAGTVLDPASATEAVDLGMLPEEPPVGEVELLVGAGRLPAPCAHP